MENFLDASIRIIERASLVLSKWEETNSAANSSRSSVTPLLNSSHASDAGGADGVIVTGLPLEGVIVTGLPLEGVVVTGSAAGGVGVTGFALDGVGLPGSAASFAERGSCTEEEFKEQQTSAYEMMLDVETCIDKSAGLVEHFCDDCDHCDTPHTLQHTDPTFDVDRIPQHLRETILFLAPFTRSHLALIFKYSFLNLLLILHSFAVFPLVV